MIVTASHVSTNSFLVVSAGQRVGTGERRAARQCRASAGKEHVCTVAIQPSPRLAGVHALPPARSVSRMMCVMPALKPIKAVRCGGLEVSSFGKRWTGAHTRVRAGQAGTGDTSTHPSPGAAPSASWAGSPESRSVGLRKCKSNVRHSAQLRARTAQRTAQHARASAARHARSNFL
jgi:hypothetical protein